MTSLSNRLRAFLSAIVLVTEVGLAAVSSAHDTEGSCGVDYLTVMRPVGVARCNGSISSVIEYVL